jgi:peptidase E
VAAVRNGLTVVGVSAGAVCWFETAFSDADGQGFRGLPGLGLLEGSCCPHYSAEPARRPAFEAAVRQGDVHGGIAIDDGVAVLCDASGAVGWFSARPEAAAYTVSRVAGRAACERLPALSSV